MVGIIKTIKIIMPPIIVELAKYFRYHIKYSVRYKKTLKKNRELQGKYSGEKCFIIGNGPSIKRQDLLKISGEHVFTVSSGYLHENYNKLSKRHHCIPSFTYTDLQGGMNNGRDEIWVREILTKTEGSELYFNITEWDLIVNKLKIPEDRINWVMTNNSCIGNSINMTKGIYPVQSVPQMAMQIALYMGFKEIYIIGVEHDFLSNKKYEYFYDAKKSLIKDPAVDDERKLTQTMLSRIYAAKTLFETYIKIDAEAKKINAKIINCSIGGDLDVFDRIDYDQVSSQL